MREMFGQLVGFDPVVSDAISVIDYFDRLVEASTGVSALLKEAAILAKSQLGYRRGARHRCFLPTGMESAVVDLPQGALQIPVGGADLVWILIDEHSSKTAAVVLERLAIALSITRTRLENPNSPSAATQKLLTPQMGHESPEVMLAAAARLRLEANGTFRALALPLSSAPPSGCPHTIIDSLWGPIRGVIVRDGFAWNAAGGIGAATRLLDLPDSWQGASIAMQLSDGSSPFVADDLGALLLALRAENAGESHATEIERVNRAIESSWTTEELTELASGGSLRAIASAAGKHHSTIEERLHRLPALLGFDPRTALGRPRLLVALMLHRLKRSIPVA